MLSWLSINSTGTDQEWTGVTKKLETSIWANLYVFHMSHRLPLSALQIQAYLTWFLLKSFLWIFSLLSQKGDHTQTYTHTYRHKQTRRTCVHSLVKYDYPHMCCCWLHQLTAPFLRSALLPPRSEAPPEKSQCGTVLQSRTLTGTTGAQQSGEQSSDF